VALITLLKYFTISAANGGGFTSEWVRVPEGFQHWQFVVLVHGRISTTAGTVQLQTSWDSVTVANLGSSTNLATVGLSSIDISSGMGPMVRLNIGCTADSSATISVFLTPKSTY
jgi:hypothetical protein